MDDISYLKSSNNKIIVKLKNIFVFFKDSLFCWICVDIYCSSIVIDCPVQMSFSGHLSHSDDLLLWVDVRHLPPSVVCRALTSSSQKLLEFVFVASVW